MKHFILFGVILLGCQTSDNGNNENSKEDCVSSISVNREYYDEKIITVKNYHGSMSEPQISRNQNVLFFNDKPAHDDDMDIHYAVHEDSEPDPDVFKYIGKVEGVNSSKLDGVPAIDKYDNFYFVSTRSYRSDFITLFGGNIEPNFPVVVDNVKQVGENLTRKQDGWLNMDLGISWDGQTLFVAETLFTDDSGLPSLSDIRMANKVGTEFLWNEKSKTILKNINTECHLEYAPTLSDNNLELFFTRAGDLDDISSLKILVSKRSKTDEPFRKPELIEAITGLGTEGPSVSFDGKTIYYHKKVGKLFQLFRVKRK